MKNKTEFIKVYKNFFRGRYLILALDEIKMLQQKSTPKQVKKNAKNRILEIKRWETHLWFILKYNKNSNWSILRGIFTPSVFLFINNRKI